MLENILNFKNSKEWTEFNNYHNSNFLKELGGIGRFENINTNYLKTILSCDDKSYKPLRLFIELLYTKDDSKFDNISLFKNYNIVLKEIITQKVMKSGTPDLVVELLINDIPYLFIIEAKLLTKEHDNQCLKYYEEINDKEEYSNHRKIFIYLSLDDNDKISSDEFIKLTYKDLFNSVYNPCAIDSIDSKLSVSTDEYMRSFVSLYEDESINYELIPLTSKDKNLTINIWNEHKIIIKEFLENEDDKNEFVKQNLGLLRILYINLYKLKNTIGLDEEIKNNLLKKIKSRAKKCQFRGESYTYGDLIYEYFKTLIDEKNIKDYIDIDKSLLITTKRYLNLISNDKYTNDLKEYIKAYYNDAPKGKQPIIINGEKYWYMKSNYFEEIQRFISAVKHYDPKEDISIIE